MIRPRTDWGAAPPAGDYSWLPNNVGLAVHWEGPHMGAYTQGAVPGLLRGIQRYHQQTQGWADIAYNFVVDRYGDVWEGRGWNARSAANGTNTSNSGYLAVCYLGGEGDPFTIEAAQGIQRLVAEHVARGGRADVTGHRDHTSTACPGDAIYNWVRSGGPFNSEPFTPAAMEDEVTDNDKVFIQQVVGQVGNNVRAAVAADTGAALATAVGPLRDDLRQLTEAIRGMSPGGQLDPAAVVDELIRRIKAA